MVCTIKNLSIYLSTQPDLKTSSNSAYSVQSRDIASKFIPERFLLTGTDYKGSIIAILSIKIIMFIITVLTVIAILSVITSLSIIAILSIIPFFL
jgi:hypothetical protein